jgi:hypothetical protein
LTYFAELSAYRYSSSQHEVNPKVRNVGWLDSNFPHSTGPVDPSIVEKLLRLCLKPVNLCRGYHQCPYRSSESPLSACQYPVRMTLDNQTIVLGNGEIRVTGEDRIVYAAPTLICHYIESHSYRPPDEFLKAVAEL